MGSATIEGIGAEGESKHDGEVKHEGEAKYQGYTLRGIYHEYNVYGKIYEADYEVNTKRFRPGILGKLRKPLETKHFSGKVPVTRLAVSKGKIEENIGSIDYCEYEEDRMIEVILADDDPRNPLKNEHFRNDLIGHFILNYGKKS